jgi:hypothetical protein
MCLLLMLLGCSSAPEYREVQASLASFGLDARAAEAHGGVVAVAPGVPDRVDDTDLAPAMRVTEQDIRDQYREREARPQPRLAVVELRYEGGLQIAGSIAPDELRAFDGLRAELAQTNQQRWPWDAVQTVPEFLLPRRLNWSNLRYCAARAGADQLLLMARASERYRYNNAWSNLYPTIIGMLLVPGETVEIHGAAEGALLDIRTGRILGVASASARTEERLFLIESSDAAERELTRRTTAALFSDLARQAVSLAPRP